VLDIWNYETSVNQYSAYGGTGLTSVEKQINNLESWIQNLPN